MFARNRLSTAKRRALFEACRGDKDCPECNLCRRPITVGQRWVESHYPVMFALGGTEVGVAHEFCNHRRWCEHEAGLLAKTQRIRDRHLGIKRSRCPLPGGRDDTRKRTLDGRVVDRASGKEWNRRASPRLDS